MNRKIIQTILKKELLETLRDKRTLIAMIGIPIILYPLLFIGIAQVAVYEQVKLQKQISRVVVQSQAAATIKEWFSQLEKVEFIEGPADQQELIAGQIDLIVTIDVDIESGLLANNTVEIFLDYDATIPRSQTAASRIAEAIKEKSGQLLAARLAHEGLPEDFARPLLAKANDIAPPAKMTGSVLGRILPMMMIIMLGVGAFYPAVDLTAGEKERGTFETLLSTPVSKSEIVCGKFLAVFVLAMITALLNLTSMGLTIITQVKMMSSAAGGEIGGLDVAALQIGFGNILVFFMIMLPLAFFICSVMMGIAMLARNFKEAQNYINPFYMMIVLPAMYASLPGVELNRTTQLIPIANVALLFKKMLTGTCTPQEIFIVFLSTILFAILALVAAVAIFQREDVILSQEKGMPLTLKRNAFKPSWLPTMGLSLAAFPLALLSNFYLGQYLQSKDIIIGTIISQYGLFLILPIFMLWYIKVNIKETLSLKIPKVSAVLVTPFLALASIVLVNLYAMWQGQFIEVPDFYRQAMNDIFDNNSVWLLLFAIALTPAICEEILTRGVIMAGLKNRMPDWLVIVLVGLMFGVMHMVISQIIPTALLGMIMAYLVLRTGSIYLGILFHFVNNGMAVLMEKRALPDATMNFMENIGGTVGGLVLLVAVAIAVFGMAIMVIEAGRKPGQLDFMKGMTK